MLNTLSSIFRRDRGTSKVTVSLADQRADMKGRQRLASSAVTEAVKSGRHVSYAVNETYAVFSQYTECMITFFKFNPFTPTVNAVWVLGTFSARPSFVIFDTRAL